MFSQLHSDPLSDMQALLSSEANSNDVWRPLPNTRRDTRLTHNHLIAITFCGVVCNQLKRFFRRTKGSDICSCMNRTVHRATPFIENKFSTFRSHSFPFLKTI